jgi:nicotinate phosphoribosyltransferase
MSYGYWKSGMAKQIAVFHLFFRKTPFKGNYAIAAGLQPVIEFLENFHFVESDLAYLRTLTGNDGKPLFEEAFLKFLGELKFDATIHAIPEGTLVFAHEPLLRIEANLILCQLLETPLLNMFNFQTLIATKSSRICRAAQGESVLEFGLRRAQGINGGLAASRAAYIGGCHATSNVLAGKLYDIPVKGTHAHSWVMSFGDELTAFSRYAAAMPNNCVFLVDTYNTIQGVKHAIQVGNSLRENGFEMAGIRLDSGDLAALSIAARKLLDEAGFPNAAIVASNDLDEYEMEKLKANGAKINVWGIGTKLVTSYDQAALGGVYKLTPIQNEKKEWEYRVKLSEQIIKISNPGILQVKRFWQEGKMVGDMIFSETLSENPQKMVLESEEIWENQGFSAENLLSLIFDQGKKVYEIPSIHESRQNTYRNLAAFAHFGQEKYAVGLAEDLYELKKSLIQKWKKQ